ncbi:MAG: ribosomal RNA small subunit methyltransferase A [Planctomycetes bacterium]|nr:ribosomal RNA small subunit methyltransferase A [Planctomycetota bacterium]
MSQPPQQPPPSGRDPFSRYRDQLSAVGFRPSSTRGQNFLLDPSLHRWIAEQAGAGEADTVVEIGVGLGFLTRELAARAGRVLAVEIEPRLLAIARRELAQHGNIEWLEADAMSGPGRSLAPRIGEVAASCQGRLMVVANLPYSVSGPLLAELCQLERLPDRVVVLVQKELGQRIASKVGADLYGGLTGLVQSMFDAQMLRDVSPSVFRPRPKVWSSIVGLDRKDQLPDELLAAAARRRFARFLRVLFGQRRKSLRNTFAAAAKALAGSPSDLPAALPAELAGQRAEELSPAQLVSLWRRCEGASGDPPPT